MSGDDDVEALRKLIEVTDRYNEEECGDLLKKAELASVLLPNDSKALFVKAELRTSAGDVDLIVVANESSPAGGENRVAYVWELKAPQLHLFEVETNSRAAPTAGLYSAENQLLHYHHVVQSNEADRMQFGVQHADRVRLGGIIIGRESRFVDPKKAAADHAASLAHRAWHVRLTQYYRRATFEVITWDMLLGRLETPGAQHLKKVDPNAAPIPLNQGPIVATPLPTPKQD